MQKVWRRFPFRWKLFVFVLMGACNVFIAVGTNLVTWFQNAPTDLKNVPARDWFQLIFLCSVTLAASISAILMKLTGDDDDEEEEVPAIYEGKETQ